MLQVKSYNIILCGLLLLAAGCKKTDEPQQPLTPVTLQCTQPAFLKQGDKVALISPSYFTPMENVEKTADLLRSWGLEPVVGPNVGKVVDGKYAGTVAERVSDIRWAMSAPDIKAILCNRGGYGTIQLINELTFDELSATPKWLIGFSDITALHCYFQAEGFASIHGPMGRHLTEEPADDFASEALRKLLFGEYQDKKSLISYTCNAHPLNHRGKAEGMLRGGNFAVYYGLRGTRYDIPPEGTILFIEDVGERPHVVERMLYNLRIGGILDRISGLILGQFTEYEENMGLGKELYGALADVVKGYHIPICFDFPVGHVTANYPLIEGSRVKLEVGKQTKLTILR